MTLDCRSCGACCISNYDNPTYVDLDREDITRLSTIARKRLEITDDGSGASIKTKRDKDNNVVCGFLRGTVGTCVSCAIYATRPRLCRQFPVGSKACLHARERLGLR